MKRKRAYGHVEIKGSMGQRYASPKTQIAGRYPTDLARKLCEYAYKQNLSVNSVLNAAVKQYMEGK